MRLDITIHYITMKKALLFTLIAMTVSARAMASDTYAVSYNGTATLQYVVDEEEKLSENEVAKIVIELLKEYKGKLAEACSVEEIINISAEIEKEYDRLSDKYSEQLKAILVDGKPKLKKFKDEIGSLIDNIAKTAEKKTIEFLKESF